MIKQQAMMYLFKVWLTTALVFPLAYTIYYLSFTKDPDGMIWLWLMIAVLGAPCCSLPCWLITYGFLLGIARYIKSVYWLKAVLCLVTLSTVAIVYVAVFGFKNDSSYSISMVFCYWCTLVGFIWLYRLRPIEYKVNAE